jgi:oligopeptidase B
MPDPPVAAKRPTTATVHGRTLSDEYAWLRQKQDPEVRAYLEAENAFTEAVMSPTRDFQSALYKELLGHIKETDESVPYPDGAYLYSTRMEEGKQYPIFCRRMIAGDSPEEITLDVNQLAAGQPFMQIGAYTVSDDGNLLAYSTDNTGFRQYTLRIRSLQTSADLPEQIGRVGSVAWANDNRTLFYTVEEPSTKRQYRLYRHLIGTDPAQDALIFEEEDERFDLGIGKSRSRKYIFMESGSHTTSEARFIPADSPDADFQLIAPRVQDEEYYVDHRGDRFYIRSNRGGRNFEIVTAPVSAPGRENWKILVGHRDDVMLEDHDMFAQHMVVMERAQGLPKIRVTDLRRNVSHEVAFPEPAYAASPAANRIWETPIFRYNYQSPVTPSSVFDYNMEDRESLLLKQFEVPGYDARGYTVQRLWATANDGVQVPLTVIFKKTTALDATAPLYLYAYGSYGYNLPLTFSSNRLALLDRGVIVALAHIRGGGELGKRWHDDGRMMNKKNTFTDFIACAEHLIAAKYADPQRIVIEGGSAGGLLMGAVTNTRPELWKAVVSKVPFVDVMNTMLDASLPLTVPEYEEWGNPNQQPAFDYMRSYSPYDNLAAGAYPAMLVKTSFNDSQVMYWEPAKYVAKLRTLKTDANPLLLHTNMAAGHGGASGRYDHLHEIAFDYAFILTQMGIPR